MLLRRYQKGHVKKVGKKLKTWYGMFREDVRTPADGIVRRLRKIRLGTLAELPTKSAALESLSRHIGITQQSSTYMRFSELVERWQQAIVPTLKFTTGRHYQNALRAYVIPYFGSRGIAEITRFDVESYLAEQAKKYGRNTLRSMRVSLSLVLSWAVDCGWLEKNPCNGVKLPRGIASQTVRTVLRPEQVREIADKLNEPYSTLTLFLAVTGLRIGEAIGVKWSDFDGDVLHICRRIYEGKADTTKTGDSDRELPIPAVLLERMKLLGGQEFIFRSSRATPVNPGNALKRYVQPAAQELGIQLGGWHDFRHTFTTGLLRSGVSPKLVSEMLGHSDVQITLDVYDHPVTENMRAPLEIVASQLFEG